MNRFIGDGRFQLNATDISKWLNNTLIFLGPALLVLIATTIARLPAGWQYGPIVLFVLNTVADLIRKFLADNTK